jgi:membrane-associated phospholipid phosphatase
MSVADPAEERKLYWWKEALIVAVFYVCYSFARNQFGSARILEGERPEQAFNNALTVIDIERAIGLFHEESIQEWFLSQRWFIQFWNVFYGTAHFVVTLGAFVWLFRRGRERFPQWRNTLAITTALGIIGFSLFPLMPPRLLNDDGFYGGNELAIERGKPGFGFVDTIAEYGGPWKFDSGTGAKISNQYAAMPSMHVGWSVWSALVMWRLTRKRWARILIVLYPWLTLFCIIVTGNHFWIDGAGGLLALGVGVYLGIKLNHWNDRRIARGESTFAG